MTKTDALKILNPILTVLVVNQPCTAALSEATSHEVFELLHEGGGVLLVVGVALHLILNWNWVKVNFLSKKPTART